LCSRPSFSEANFPKLEQSKLRRILTNALNVGLVPVDLAEIGSKALSSEARKYVLFELLEL
jgi:hypothetical protein